MSDFLAGLLTSLACLIPLYFKVRKLERADKNRDTAFKQQIATLDERYNRRDAALIQLLTSKLDCIKDEQLKAIDQRLTRLEDTIIQALKAQH